MTTKRFWRFDQYALNIGNKDFHRHHMAGECLDYRRSWAHTKEFYPDPVLHGTWQGTPFNFTCPNCGYVSATVFVPYGEASRLRGEQLVSLDQYEARTVENSSSPPTGCTSVIFKLTEMTAEEEEQYWLFLRAKTRPRLYPQLVERFKRDLRQAGRD